MCLEKEAPGFSMAGHALQQREGIANAITHVGSEVGRTEERIDIDYLLQKRGHDTEGMPEHCSQVIVLLTLLAKIKESSFTGVRILELDDERIDSVLFGKFALFAGIHLRLFSRLGSIGVLVLRYRRGCSRRRWHRRCVRHARLVRLAGRQMGAHCKQAHVTLLDSAGCFPSVMSFQDIEAGLPQAPSAFKSLQSSLSLQVFKLNSNIQGILKLVDQLGSSRDNATLRKTLHDLTESTREMSKRAGEQLKNLALLVEGDTVKKQAFEKTSHDVQRSLVAFQNAQRVSSTHLI